MATYLQGATDYIPQIQPFQPNLNFYKGVLDTKEAQYKQGYDKLSQIYGKLMNSPLTRENNVNRREDFFNKVNTEIERLSGIDLSLEQNVDSAYEIFQPMINDDYLMKDMAWTKNLMNEYQRAEGFRNCTNEKLCGGKWWEEGVQALDFMRMDFSNASDDESLRFGNVKYTPFVNVTEKAFSLAKDMGFNVQSVTWQNGGRYIVTEKNGKNMILPLTSFFQSTIGNDPSVKEYYQTLSYLDRKNFSYSNAEKYGSEESAERFYLEDKLTNINNAIKKQQEELDKQNDVISTDMQLIKEKDRDDGIDPDKDQSILEYYQSLNEQKQVVDDNKRQSDDIKGLADYDSLKNADISVLRNRVDSAYSGILMNQDLQAAATQYAYLNNEVDVKADPYAQASYEHSLDMAKMAQEQKYKIQFEQYKVAMGLVEDSYGGRTKEKGSTRSGGTSNPFNTSPMTAYKPVEISENNAPKENLFDFQSQETAATLGSLRDNENGYLLTAFNELQNQYNNSKSDARKKKAAQGLEQMFNGKANIQKAINAGVMDKNYTIKDVEKFQTFMMDTLNSDGQMIQRTKTFVDQSKSVGFFSPEIYNGFDSTYENYNDLKQLYDAKKERYDANVNNVKNNMLQEADTAGSQKSWIGNAWRWASDKIYSVAGFFGADQETLKSYRKIDENIANDIDDIFDEDDAAELNKIYITKMFDKNNRIVDKDTFVKNVEKDYQDNTGMFGEWWDNTKVFSVLGFLRRPYSEVKSWFTGEDELETKRRRMHLDDMYKTFSGAFKREYQSGKLLAYPQDTNRYQSALSAVVDFAEYDTDAYRDMYSVLENFKQYENRGEVRILQGANHDRDEVLDVPSNLAKKDDPVAENIANYLFSKAFRSDYDYKDDERPMVTFIGKPMAANDMNLTGYTFVVNEEFLAKNAGTKDKPGIFSDAFENGKMKEGANMFTIYIPKELANNTFYQEKTKMGPFKELVNVYNKPVSVSLPQGGNIEIKKGSDGVVYANGTLRQFNPQTGQYMEASLADLGLSTFSMPADEDIDFYVAEWKKTIREQAQQNLALEQAYYNANPKKRNLLNQ